MGDDEECKASLVGPLPYLPAREQLHKSDYSGISEQRHACKTYVRLDAYSSAYLVYITNEISKGFRQTQRNLKMSINDWSKSLVNRSLGLFRLMNQAADSSRRKEQHDEVPKRNIVKKEKIMKGEYFGKGIHWRIEKL